MARWSSSALALALAACSHSPAAPADAYVAIDAPTHAGPGPGGGTLDNLVFAVIGDTRPLNVDDTPNYPTAIASAIFADVEADPAKPPFLVTTGDYMDASTSPGTEVDPQLDLYLGARAGYSGVVYPAMGNHECASLVQSNCGPHGADGEPPNYSRFVARLVAPIGETKPYYIERFAAADASWTAKLVVIAANAWDDAQAAAVTAWLDDEPTTYTFVVRHEPPDATAALGVTPTTQLLATVPVTLLLTGHVHTYMHVPEFHEIVVGNGGAPLQGDIDHGYAIVARQTDGTLQVTMKDYQSLAVIDQFSVFPDGSPAP